MRKSANCYAKIMQTVCFDLLANMQLSGRRTCVNLPPYTAPSSANTDNMAAVTICRHNGVNVIPCSLHKDCCSYIKHSKKWNTVKWHFDWILSDLFVLFLDSIFARQHVIEPIHFERRKHEVHQFANAHQCYQLQQQNRRTAFSVVVTTLRACAVYDVEFIRAEINQR